MRRMPRRGAGPLTGSNRRSDARGRGVRLELGQVALAGAIGQLDPQKTTVVVCRSGNRSELATLMLRARGFENTAVLDEGILVWRELGHPVEGESVGE